MNEQILINVTPQETRVAVTEQGAVQELHIEREASRGLVGNIYLGRVCRVLPGMQSAFVEIGLPRAAFLHVGDIWAARNGNGTEVRPIEKILSEGQTVLIQVVKDPIGSKGARITCHISLPGRHLVFMPTVDHVGISRRIENEKERRRLRELVDKFRPQGTGFIVRTVAENEPSEKLTADIKFLLSLWNEVGKKR
ncbi:MAG TPA: ribonuclease E/G, partial [Usitatibacter sp.]|nr:ribonuclease E/G [Usitatibacter sp.]